MEGDEKSIKFLPLKHVFSKSLGGKKIGGLRPLSPLVAPLRLHSGVVPGEG